MGFIRRVREAMHESTCKMKLGILATNRTTELLLRGMPRNLAEEQASKELGLFLALLQERDIYATTKEGSLFVEENFPSFTKMIDSKSARAGGEDSTRLTNPTPISSGHDSDRERG